MKSILISVLISFLHFPSYIAPSATLSAQINDARSDKGKILVLVFNDPDGFPDKVEKAFKKLVLQPKNRKAELILENLPAGKYAFTVLHDEDDNGIMNTSRIGIPQEKYGFSNNPKIYFGPPSFEKSAVQVGAKNKTIQINIR